MNAKKTHAETILFGVQQYTNIGRRLLLDRYELPCRPTKALGVSGDNRGGDMWYRAEVRLCNSQIIIQIIGKETERGIGKTIGHH